MLLRKLQGRENTFSLLYCIYWKKPASKWTSAVQTYVVQGYTVYRNEWKEEGSKI